MDFSQDIDDCLLMSGDWPGISTKNSNFLLQEEEQPMVTHSRANYWTRNGAAKGWTPSDIRKKLSRPDSPAKETCKYLW